MAKLAEYRGYHAKFEYDPDDNIFVGSVIGISDSLNFHAENTAELIEIFHNSIDNYLTFCAQVGKTPDKEYSGTFNVRVSPELHKKASLKAQEEDISLNKVVENALTSYFSTDNILIDRFTKGIEVFADSVKSLSSSISLTTASAISNNKFPESNYFNNNQNRIALSSSNYSMHNKIIQ